MEAAMRFLSLLLILFLILPLLVAQGTPNDDRIYDEVRRRLAELKAAGATTFNHGLCIGADEQAAAIADELGYYVVAFPGYSSKNPGSRLFRSEFQGNDETRPEKTCTARDRDIVNESDLMLGAPKTPEEQLRSGTWTTLRYAKKVGRPREVIDP
jgi:hypothetical protein